MDDLRYEFNSNPQNINFYKSIIKKSNCNKEIYNAFIVFKSFNDILYIIYAIENSIISYDLINDQNIIKIKNAHLENISNFRNYKDNINKIDLIISISHFDNNLKLWNINNWQCLYNYKNINENGFLYSACFLRDNNNTYIITSNYYEKLSDNSEAIKVFDLKGNIIKKINGSNEMTKYIDSFYDNKLSKNYIISSNLGHIKSYDYEKNKIYNIYNIPDYSINRYLIINKKEDKVILIAAIHTTIKIWDFNSSEILHIIEVKGKFISSICLWNNELLFIGYMFSPMKLIEIKTGKIIKCIESDNNSNITLKKILHPKFGECLISQRYFMGEIIFWINNN